jgi:hypothetical protein
MERPRNGRTWHSAGNKPTIALWRDSVCNSDLDSSAKLVALVISTYMGKDRLTAWPSRATIASAASLTVRTVERAIRRIEQSGLLKIVWSDGGNNRPNLYAAAFPSGSAVEDLGVRANGRRRGGEAQTPRPGDSEASRRERRSPESAEGATRARRPRPSAAAVPLEECGGCLTVAPLPDGVYCTECNAKGRRAS